MTWEEYEDGLRVWKFMSTKFKMGFADYLAFGRRKWKNKVDALLGQLEFDLPMVSSATQIANVPTDVRQPHLEAEHYIVLSKADLTKKQQIKWAKVASEQRLSPSTLKASINMGEVVSPALAKQRTSGIISINGIRLELDIWLQRVGGIEGIDKMEEAAQQDIAVELEKFVQIYLHIRKLKTVFLEPMPEPEKPKKKRAKKAAK
jgi:hypothetical protein